LKVTIVMYHYVRDLERSRYPQIKGLDLELFRGQITYLKKHYNVISGYDLLDAVRLGHPLPPRSLMLTFDDGYVDHFTNVLPILDRERLPGCFFVPAGCIRESCVLDVNKVHFLLAAVEDKGEIVEQIFRLLKEADPDFSEEQRRECWIKFAQQNRWDSKEVVFIKRFLQRAEPVARRERILNSLFRRYVTSDEAAFSQELYMTVDQIGSLRSHGMYIGNHGYKHCWLNSIDQEAQQREINLSLAFLRDLGCVTSEWMMCYPYGGYDDSLLSILRNSGCKVGLTTRVGIADLAAHDALTLPRLDTNDLPRGADASRDAWFVEAAGEFSVGTGT